MYIPPKELLNKDDWLNESYQDFNTRQEYLEFLYNKKRKDCKLNMTLTEFIDLHYYSAVDNIELSQIDYQCEKETNEY